MRNQKGKNNNAYKDGRTLKKYYCKCGKKLSSYTVKYCKSCNAQIAWKKGILKPHKSGNYKSGKYSKIRYCIDCGIKISKFPTIRCRKCYVKYNRGKFSGGWKETKHNDKRKCCNCNKLIDYRSLRCRECEQSRKRKSGYFKGKNNPRFGLPPAWKRITYGKTRFRSSWEVAYAKYLKRNKTKWLYESKTFDLGNCTYTPDFYLPEIDTFIEIKGYMNKKTSKKIELFKKIYNKINFVILYQKDLLKLNLINKRGKII